MGIFRSKLKNVDIIVLLGPTGAGKSTFGNVAAGKCVFDVNNGLECCTDSVQVHQCPNPADSTREVLLVDTPAFNSTLSVETVEKRIKAAIRKAGQRHAPVTGIVYLHRISDVKLNENPIHHIRMFQNLCGEQPARRMILATTMWKNVDTGVGSTRESQLATTCWHHFISGGSCMKRFEFTQESAWDIINTLLDQSRR